MTKYWKKITAEKKFNFFGSKTTINLSLGLHKEPPSYRRSLQLSTKEAIQHFKTWTLNKFSHFFGSFLPSWIRIGIRIPNTDLYPDPLTRLNPDPIRIRIRIRIRNPAMICCLWSVTSDMLLLMCYLWSATPLCFVTSDISTLTCFVWILSMTFCL